MKQLPVEDPAAILVANGNTRGPQLIDDHRMERAHSTRIGDHSHSDACPVTGDDGVEERTGGFRLFPEVESDIDAYRLAVDVGDQLGAAVLVCGIAKFFRRDGRAREQEHRGQ
jgi:hypothetical protein